MEENVNPVVELDTSVLRDMVIHNKHDQLRRLLFRGNPPEEWLIGGDLARVTVLAIALRPKYSKNLVQLALDIVVPWIDPLALCELVDTCVPYAHIVETTNDEVEEFDLDEAEQSLGELTEDRVLALMRYIYHVDSVQFTRHFAWALARRVYTLSTARHVKCFFGSGQKALLVFANFIGTEEDGAPSNARYEDGDDTEDGAPCGGWMID